MANWGEAVRIWAAFGVGARLAGGCPPRSGDCHRLPPSAKALPLSAKGLPLSAKTCHHLPRPASFWSGPWRSRGPLRSSVFNRCVGIVLMGLMLGHGGSWKGTGMRSVASDLLLENVGRGNPRPVTVCHINPAAWRRKPFPREAGPLSSPTPSLALRAGVRGFMVTRGVFNMSPMRERGDLGRGDLSVGFFGGGQTVSPCRSVTRPVEHEEHGPPSDGKTVAHWNRGGPLQGFAVFIATCSQGVALGCDGAHLWCSGRDWCSGRGDLRSGVSARSETCAEQSRTIHTWRGRRRRTSVEWRYVITVRTKDPLLSRDSCCCNNTCVHCPD